jgi:hypothetical protein
MADQTGGATRLQTSITTGVPKPGDSFLLGVNYWPRRKAMYFWTQFDPVRGRDGSPHQDAGSVVRFFLRWEAFQPALTDRPTADRKLGTVAQVASDVASSSSRRLQRPHERQELSLTCLSDSRTHDGLIAGGA